MNAKDMPVSESAKKVYIQPQIVFKQKLEVMAVTCTSGALIAKASTGAGCDPGNLFS